MKKPQQRCAWCGDDPLFLRYDRRGPFPSIGWAATASRIHASPSQGSFPLVVRDRATPLVFSPGDHTVVSISVEDLAADIERVTGIRPPVYRDADRLNASAVLIGTIGESPLIDGLVRAGKLDASDLSGAWECFVIATVDDPPPRVSPVCLDLKSIPRMTNRPSPASPSGLLNHGRIRSYAPMPPLLLGVFSVWIWHRRPAFRGQARVSGTKRTVFAKKKPGLMVQAE